MLRWIHKPFTLNHCIETQHGLPKQQPIFNSELHNIIWGRREGKGEKSGQNLHSYPTILATIAA